MPKTIESTITANVINGDTDQKIFYSDYIAKINRQNPIALKKNNYESFRKYHPVFE